MTRPESPIAHRLARRLAEVAEQQDIELNAGRRKLVTGSKIPRKTDGGDGKTNGGVGNPMVVLSIRATTIEGGHRAGSGSASRKAM